jgi:anti-sigma factor RsiW
MTQAQFQRLLDVHGTDPSRWPADRRSAAEARLATDPAARHALDTARRLDGSIRRLGSGGDDGASAARVMSNLAGPLPPQRRPSWARWWPAEMLDMDFSPAWPRVAALAAFATLGFAVGLADVQLLGNLTSAPMAGMEATDDLMSTIFEPDPLPGIRR